MKLIMEKIDVVVKLKERIAEARVQNEELAIQLQKLLDGILKDSKTTASI
jgi:hypothetical protein